MSIATEFNVAEHLREIVGDVFQTMVSAPAVLTKDHDPLPPERISGTIGIAGDNVTGAVYLHLPDALARAVTRTMLQDTSGQGASDNDMNDVLGELTNMVGGGLKSHLNDAGFFCAMSTPSIIRGIFAVDVTPDLSTDKIFFLCLGQRFVVEVHLKFF
jgi:chemotaxis protein CheX